ncbi:hypothetical protein Dda_6788 [Drechslerella dactyloides]|uniref:Uncharacterized protein n=1 Tax=Drechslerella dactyloides TaxID=74499 RepID=A0AAD6IY36_DREDA|nr:hypothetical protein Dda_6788 [Drechslerella dactyloides]
MKLPRLQAILEASQSRPPSRTAAPFAIADRLSRAINYPVLTPKESNQLLSEINSSFRKALDESRHPNDIRPPARITNAYANRADHHVSTLLVDKPNLRNLLEPGQLTDPGPIALLKQHIEQGTATELLAIDCLKSYISLYMKRRARHPGTPPLDDAGRQIWDKLKNSPLMLGKPYPDPPLRQWLTPALLLSNKPTIPFTWFAQLVDQQRVEAAAMLRDILVSMKKIFGADDTVTFFVHFVKLRMPEYRDNNSLHPQLDLTLRLHNPDLTRASLSFQQLYTDSPPLLSKIAESLYSWAGPAGKELLADNIKLWDTPITRSSASMSLSQHGDVNPAVQYFRNLWNANRTAQLVGLKKIQLAMRAVQRLAVTGRRSMAVDLADIMVKSISSMGVATKHSREMRATREAASDALARFIEGSDDEQLDLVTDGTWEQVVAGLRHEKTSPETVADRETPFVLAFK